WITSRDIYWDRVIEIEDAGEREVYDLEVGSTSCFIGNDVVLHNSTLAVHFASTLNAVLIDLEPWGGATAWWAGRHANELWQAPGPAPVLKALARGIAPRPRRGEAGRPRLVPSHEQLLSLTSGGPT